MNRPMEPDPHTQGLKAWHFIKASRALADPGATVKISGVSDQVDWEVELVAVIGRAAKNVPEDKALAYVAGYTAANDLSARDRGRRAEHRRHLAVQGRLDQAQDLRRLVPARALDRAGERHRRPQNLGLKLWVNDVLKQDSNSKDMIFNLAEQIAQLSSGMTLHPGDLILTGTPAGVGVGARRVPQTRRCGQDLDRKDRDTEQQDGLSAIPVDPQARRQACRRDARPTLLPLVAFKHLYYTNDNRSHISARIALGRPPRRRPKKRRDNNAFALRRSSQGGVGSMAEQFVGKTSEFKDGDRRIVFVGEQRDRRVPARGRSTTPTAISACIRAARPAKG